MKYFVELDYFIQESAGFTVEANSVEDAESKALDRMARDYPDALDPFVITVKSEVDLAETARDV